MIRLGNALMEKLPRSLGNRQTTAGSPLGSLEYLEVLVYYSVQLNGRGQTARENCYRLVLFVGLYSRAAVFDDDFVIERADCAETKDG